MSKTLVTEPKQKETGGVRAAVAGDGLRIGTQNVEGLCRK